MSEPYQSEVLAWIPDGGGSVHIKTYETYGDPVELGEDEVYDLIRLLTKLLKEVQGDRFDESKLRDAPEGD